MSLKFIQRKQMHKSTTCSSRHRRGLMLQAKGLTNILLGSLSGASKTLENSAAPSTDACMHRKPLTRLDLPGRHQLTEDFITM